MPIPFGYVRCPSCQTDVRLPAHEPVTPIDPDLPAGIDLAFGRLEAVGCPACGATVEVPADQAWSRPKEPR